MPLLPDLPWPSTPTFPLPAEYSTLTGSKSKRARSGTPPASPAARSQPAPPPAAVGRASASQRGTRSTAGGGAGGARAARPLAVKAKEAPKTVAQTREVPERVVTTERIQFLLGNRFYHFVEPGSQFMAFNREALLADLRALARGIRSPLAETPLAGGFTDEEILTSPVFVEFLAWQRVQQLKARSTVSLPSGVPNVQRLASDADDMDAPPVAADTEAGDASAVLSELLQKLQPSALWRPQGTRGTQTANFSHPYFNMDCPEVHVEPPNGGEQALKDHIEALTTAPPVASLTSRRGVRLDLMSQTVSLGRRIPTELDCVRSDSAWKFDFIDLVEALALGAETAQRVSARHATIFLHPKKRTFYLLNYSEFGTVVDSQPVGDLPVELHEGSVLRIAGQTLTFVPNPPPTA